MKIAIKVRAPNLTKERVDKIIEIIDLWTERKLTWAAIISAVEKKLRAKYTRQALSRNPRIQIAYESKNEFLAKRSTGPKSTGSPALDEALKKIEELETEIERRKKTENALLEQFARWASNATEAGIDYRYLDRPIGAVDRDASLTKPAESKVNKK